MSDTTDKSDEKDAARERRDYMVEIVSAVVLGLATVLGAFAAYQSSLWDKFTLLTVFFTVTLFFAGLASVIRRFPIKTAFLGIAAVLLAYSSFLMLGMKLAS